MKYLLIILSLFSAVAEASEPGFQYLDYKELSMNRYPTGAYPYVTTCDSNDLYWNKATKSYNRTVYQTNEKGVDIVQYNGNTMKIISSYKTDDSTGYSEMTTNFITENTFIRNKITRIIFDDKTEFNSESLTEGSYKNGNVILSRWVFNGVEKQLSQLSKSNIVWLDKEGMDVYETSTYESSQLEAQMQNPSYNEVLLKTEMVCKTHSSKL